MSAMTDGCVWVMVGGKKTNSKMGIANSHNALFANFSKSFTEKNPKYFETRNTTNTHLKHIKIASFAF